MKRLVVAGVIIVAITGGVWFFANSNEAGAPLIAGTRAENAIRHTLGDSSGASIERIEDSAARTNKVTASVVESQEGRSTASQRVQLRPEAVLSGRVANSIGQPIVDAQVSWTPIPPQLYKPDCSRDEIAKFASRKSVTVTTNEAGGYFFHKSSMRDEWGPSVLWITHEAHHPTGIEFTAGDSKLDAPVDCKLFSASASTVHVSRVSGGPVPDAVIEQTGRSTHLSKESFAGKTGGSRLAWLLHRTSKTQQFGNASLQVMPGTQEIVAFKGELSSTPWVGVAEGRIDLTIGESIEIGGMITLASHVKKADVFRLEVEAILGSRVFGLESIEVTEGEWGLITVPFLEADEYRVRLSGINTRPQVKRFRPQPGKTLGLDFDLEYGFGEWFYVTDEEGQPLPNAELTVWWEEDGRRIELHAPARKDGFLAIGGLRPGLIEGQFTCSGYAPELLTPLLVPSPEQTAFNYVLQRGGSLRGNCMADGAPVQDFEISVWPIGQEVDAVTHRVSNPDGSFNVDAPLGNVMMRGAAAGVGISDQFMATVGEGSAGGVIVELITGIEAFGRIEDRETGSPLPDSTVEISILGGGSTVFGSGAPISANHAGEFQVSGLPRGDAQILVSAPGYSKSVINFTGQESEDLNLGVVRLTKTHSLDVLLYLNEEIPAGTFVDLTGLDAADQREFQDDGTASFEHVSPGRHLLTVSLPDGSLIQKTFTMPRGKSWKEVFNLAGDCTVHAEIENLGDLPIAEMAFFARSEFRGRDIERSIYFENSNRITLKGLRPGPTYFELSRYDGSESRVIALEKLELEPGSEQIVRFRIGEGDRKLRILDRSGSPLQGVLVSAFLPGSEIAWEEDIITGAQGECTLRGLEGDSFFLHLNHPAAGYRIGIEVEEPPSDRVIELTLDGSATAQFVFSTPEGPASGIEPQLGDVHLGYWISSGFTDDYGAIVWSKLSEGEYFLALDDPHYWPVEQRLRIQENGAPVPIRVYRRVELTAETRTLGLPRVDVVFELFWIDGGQDVSALVSSGDINAEPGNLRTSSDGTLRLKGLPQGDFRWTARAGDELQTGVVSLRPDALNELLIEIP